MRALLLSSLPLLAATLSCPPPGPSTRPCWDKFMELDLNRDPDGNLPPGGEDPACDSRGHFLAKQCSGSQCYCVEPSGSQLSSPDAAGRYTSNRWEADDMMCNCAVEEANIAKEGSIGKTVHCDDKGDYHHTQCTGSQCYCVQQHTGEKRPGTDSNVIDLDRLEVRCAKEAQ